MKHIASRILKTTMYSIVIIPSMYSMELAQNVLHHIFPNLHHATHQQDTQIAQYNLGISEGEKAYRQQRLPIVKAALEKMLNQTLEEKQIPIIAMIGSGGGYRAAQCTTGSLCGADKIGLLDATTYITALSGSTWAVAPWIVTGKPIQEFRGYLKECVAKPFLESTLEEKELMLKAVLEKINKKPFTPVDVYGFCLANRLLESLGEKRQMVTLSQLANTISQGTHPYPIFTATDGRETIVTGQTWYEFTPHTIGDRNNNIHIPTTAYGSIFKQGKLKKQTHEKSLGYGMGTWGSAFGANIRDIIEEIIKDPAIRKEIESLIPNDVEADRPLHFYAKVPNYMYKMNNVADKTITTNKYMDFVDSGLEINLPYPPISGICAERAPEILIFLDSSAGPVGEQLQKVAAYAQKYTLPFPTIDYTDIDKKTISIFKDESNPQAPVVIYMPRISDKDLWEKNRSKPEFAQFNLSDFDLDKETSDGYCKTQEFQYTPEHSELVMNQTEFNMLVNRDKIIETIKWCIDRK